MQKWSQEGLIPAWLHYMPPCYQRAPDSESYSEHLFQCKLVASTFLSSLEMIEKL